MLQLDNGGRMVERVCELPDLRHAKELFADFETRSGDRKLTSLNPWRHCGVAGLAVTVDDVQGAWYLPVGHSYGVNLPEEAVIAWWSDVVGTASEWINHNVKYDMHVSTNAWGILPEMAVNCTLTQAKIFHSDRLQYGLDHLSRDWLGADISQHYERLRPYLDLAPGQGGNKDYGQTPSDLMAPYACEDAMTCRRLSRYIKANLPADCSFVSGVERGLTTMLFEMERTGMRVDPLKLRVKEVLILHELDVLERRLEQLVGRSFRPHVAQDCLEVLCGKYGLPVLEYTTEEEGDDEERNASFNKHAMAQYLVHPFAPHEVVKLIVRCRHLRTLLSVFVRKYQVEAVDHGSYFAMHPNYNQAVRTGRLGCKDPNAMALSKEAKELVLPPIDHDDYGPMSILSCDDSQIEYRTIVHYCRNERAIQAYRENPDTDFHQLVADMIEETMGLKIDRSPAKTCNFLMGYGGGKARLLRSLEMNVELMGGVKDQVAQLIADGRVRQEDEREAFAQLAKRRAEGVYTAYHDNLPELKRTSKDVERTCKMRSVDGYGYVSNLCGRRRHLPASHAWRGFNTINQSSAADLMKARMVKLWRLVREAGLPISFMAQVHDDLSMVMPSCLAESPDVRREIAAIMEQPVVPDGVQLRVPLRVAIGHSRQDWRRASKGVLKDKSDEPKPVMYDRSEVRGLQIVCEEVLSNSSRVQSGYEKAREVIAG